MTFSVWIMIMSSVNTDTITISKTDIQTAFKEGGCCSQDYHPMVTRFCQADINGVLHNRDEVLDWI